MILRFDQWSGKSGLLVGAGITTVIVLSLAETLSLLPITLITHLAKEILFLSNRSSNQGHHAELWPFVSSLSHEFSSPLCPRPPPLLRRQSCPLPSFSEQRTPGKRSHGHHRQVSGRQTSPPGSPRQPHRHQSVPEQLKRRASLRGEDGAGSV